jgi:chromosome segregation ATPase
MGCVTLLLASFGCATTKDLDTVRSQLSDQIAAVRAESTKSSQAVESLRTDVSLLKSLAVAVDSMKGRLEGMQTALQGMQSEAESHRTGLANLRGDFREFRVAHEGVARETDRLRMSVGSIEQGMMHQLQMEVNLSRERIKQLEQVIESLQKPSPPKEKEGGQPRL